MEFENFHEDPPPKVTDLRIEYDEHGHYFADPSMDVVWADGLAEVGWPILLIQALRKSGQYSIVLSTGTVINFTCARAAAGASNYVLLEGACMPSGTTGQVEVRVDSIVLIHDLMETFDGLVADEGEDE